MGVLKEPERLLTTAQEEVLRRGLVKSESKLKGELTRIDGELTRTREALGRLARYHAERGTLDEGTFEAAGAPLREKVAKLGGHREHLVSALPDVAWRQDEKAFATVASEVLDRLDGMEFSERQRLIALLDVRVDLESDGRISASLSAPKPGDLGPDKVFSYTFSRSDRSTSR